MLSKILTKIKTESKVLTGTTTRIKKTVDCRHLWYGNKYGGFYVHPNLLNKESIIYSFGIGEDISFDKTMIENHDCTVFGFDPTPKSISWINSHPQPEAFKFFAFGINDVTGFVDFNLPSNESFVSGSVVSHINVNTNNSVSVPMKSFIDIATELGHKHVDVLKMDIEGSEYQLIEDILSSPIKIDQILIEIHERFFDDGKLKTQTLLKSFASYGYAIFAVSDTMEEISFIRKDVLK